MEDRWRGCIRDTSSHGDDGAGRVEDRESKYWVGRVVESEDLPLED